MSWEILLDTRAKIRQKLDFRDVYTGNSLSDIAVSNIYAMSDNFKFNILLIERSKSEETNIFLEKLSMLGILGPDVLV